MNRWRVKDKRQYEQINKQFNDGIQRGNTSDHF